MENDMYYIYRYVDKRTGEIVYVGKSINLKGLHGRIASHRTEPQFSDYIDHCRVEYSQLNSKAEMDIKELVLINKYAPAINRAWCPEEPIEDLELNEMEWCEYNEKQVLESIVKPPAERKEFFLMDTAKHSADLQEVYELYNAAVSYYEFLIVSSEDEDYIIQNPYTAYNLYVSADFKPLDQKYGNNHWTSFKIFVSYEELPDGGGYRMEPRSKDPKSVLAPLRKQINAWATYLNYVYYSKRYVEKGFFLAPHVRKLSDEREERLRESGICVDFLKGEEGDLSYYCRPVPGLTRYALKELFDN